MIPSNIIDEIKLKTNIVDVISEVASLKKNGKSCCPFLDHKDSTPSFSVSESKQIYKCFGKCQRSGNVFTFLVDYHGYTFIEAVKYLAEQAGVDIPYQGKVESDLIDEIYSVLDNYTLACKDVYGVTKRDYFQGRGLSKETIEKFELGFDSGELSVKQVMGGQSSDLAIEESGLVSAYNFNTKNKFANRYTFPIHDQNGRVVSMGGTNKSAEPKYLNGPDTKVYSKSNILYGLHQAKKSIKDNGYAILVEGYMDCLQMVNHKFENTIASCGTSVTFQHAKLLSRYAKSVILFFDGDDAGKEAIDKTFVVMFDQGVDTFVIDTPKKEDPDSLVLKHGDQVNGFLNTALMWFDFRLKRYTDIVKRKNQIQLVKDLAREFESEERRLLFLDLSAKKLGVDVRMFNGVSSNRSASSGTDISEIVDANPEQSLLLAACMFNDKRGDAKEMFTIPEFKSLYEVIVKAKDESDLYLNLNSDMAIMMGHIHSIYLCRLDFDESLFLVKMMMVTQGIKTATEELYSAERSITDTTKLINEVNRLIKLKQELVQRRQDETVIHRC